MTTNGNGNGTKVRLTPDRKRTITALRDIRTPMAPVKLARKFGTDEAQATKLLDGLVKVGLAERLKAGTYRLTDDGMSVDI